jgi:adhesin/invasin
MGILRVWLTACVVLFAMASCGVAPSGSTTGTSQTGVGGSGVGGSLPASKLTLTSSVTTSIAATGSAVITANVVDSYGTAVVDGTEVLFTSNLTGTSITSSVLTLGGIAKATFNANNVAGSATVTAESGIATGIITVDIQPSPPALITLQDVLPAQVGVQGSGLPQIAVMTFSVTDNYGNPVSDGTTVAFSISSALGGGETISPISVPTNNGSVSVTVTAGKKAGLLGVNALVAANNIVTTGTLAIQGGIAFGTNFSLETQSASFEGMDLIGNTNTFTIFAADMFGNPIRKGTLVSFITEVGSMPSAFTDSVGIATSTYTTPGGDPYTTLKGHPLGAGTGKGGYLTVLAMIKGQESFSDNNNNGVYDAGDSFNPTLHDLGEPFLDTNENGIFDIGEPYNDSNGDGAYTAPNGVHDVDTVLWQSIVVVLSTTSYSVSPVLNGANNYFITVLDNYNNPIDSTSLYKTSLSFTATGSPGTITGNQGSSIPFSVVYNLANPLTPNVPVYVPTFTNTTVTGHLAGDVLRIEVVSPSKILSIDGL